jgi:hypothetical protein
MRAAQLDSTEVEAPGIEPTATSAPSVANGRENDEGRATQDDSRQRGVSASTDRTRGATTGDADAAIRAAAKVAIDAGDLERARALLDLLDARPAAATVVTLASRRGPD